MKTFKEYLRENSIEIFVSEKKITLTPEEVDMRSEIRKHLDHLKDKAAHFWPELKKKYQFKNIKLEYTDKIEGAQAQAWIPTNTIEIGIDSLKRDKKRMFDEIIGHELVHLILPLLFPNVGYEDHDAHGNEWQALMKKMNFAIDPIDLVY